MPRPFLHARSHALWISAACAAALAAVFACTRPLNIHESEEAKGKPCFSCHEGAYLAAKNPLHANKMPLTCQDCHDTKAWSPSSVTDHYWWPILNKHVGVSCVACHTKGFAVGDTSKDCVSCHRKDYESSMNPPHVTVGKDQYPLDCAMCHTDSAPDHFKPSPWTHWDAGPPPVGYELIGSHLITRPTFDDAGTILTPTDSHPHCAGCHTGTPPMYTGTTKDCHACHKAEAEAKGSATKPDHTSSTFPQTCLDCHLISGWKQGPPLGFPHNEASFPIATGPHAGAGAGCQGCHDLSKGRANVNVDCIHCHVATSSYPQGAHVAPAIDAYHLNKPDGGAVAGYATAQTAGGGTTNFCLQCHNADAGVHR